MIKINIWTKLDKPWVSICSLSQNTTWPLVVKAQDSQVPGFTCYEVDSVSEWFSQPWTARFPAFDCMKRQFAPAQRIVLQQINGSEPKSTENHGFTDKYEIAVSCKIFSNQVLEQHPDRSHFAAVAYVHFSSGRLQLDLATFSTVLEGNNIPVNS